MIIYGISKKLSNKNIDKKRCKTLIMAFIFYGCLLWKIKVLRYFLKMFMLFDMSLTSHELKLSKISMFCTLFMHRVMLFIL